MKIAQLEAETAQEDWDSEGGEIVRASQWEDARSVASRATRDMVDVPHPFVSACGDGTVHLQWTTRDGDRGVLEIGPQRFWWSSLSRSGEGDEVAELRSPDDVFARVRKIFESTS